MTVDRLWFDPSEILIDGHWRSLRDRLPVEDPSLGRQVGGQVIEQGPEAPNYLVLAGPERPNLVEGQGDQIVPRGGRDQYAHRPLLIGHDAGREVLGGGITQHILDAMEALDRRGRVVHRR